MEHSRFNAETVIEGQTYRYIALMPYDKINSESSAISWNDLRICDEQLFWQSPYEK